MPFVERVEVQHQIEARVASRMIDRSDVDEHRHVAGRIIAEKAHRVVPDERLDHRTLVAMAR